MIPADAAVAVPVGALCAVGGFIIGYWLSRLLGLREVAAVQAELEALRAASDELLRRSVKERADLRARLGIEPFHSSYCPCRSCTALAPVGVIKAGSNIEGEP